MNWLQYGPGNWFNVEALITIHDTGDENTVTIFLQGLATPVPVPAGYVASLRAVVGYMATPRPVPPTPQSPRVVEGG